MDDSFENIILGSKTLNDRCFLIVNEIKSGKSNVLKLVENLQSLLTSTGNEQRIKGITILSTVLNGVPADCVPSNEANVLANFLCERLRDHHEVVPSVIKTLVIVVNTTNLTNGTAKKILSAIFNHVPCQQQQQADRFNIYSIFKTLHETKKEELKDMGLELIYGIVTAIDGERDPRNLSFLFEWLESFLNEFELGHLSEEMFEVLACYFPVDFRPCAEDAITRDSLASSLSKCLCASQKFGDFVVPLALEKLESELTTAKMDSLDVLDLVSQRFPSDLLLKYSTGIWTLLYKEIISAQDEELQSRALKTFSNFVKGLSSQPENFIFNLLNSIILNVKGNTTPDSKLFDVSCKILFATASSRYSSELIVNTMIPLWTNLYKISTSVDDKVEILKALCELCVVAVDSLPFDHNPILKDLPISFLISLTESENKLKLEALKCFKRIALYVSIALREALYENLKILFVLPLEYDERTVVLECFREYAKLYPKEIEDVIKEFKRNGKLKLYLELAGSVLEIKQLWPLTIKELTTYTLGNSKDISQFCLYMLIKNLDNEDLGLEGYLVEKENFIFKLTSWFVNCFEELNMDDDTNVLDGVSKILYRVIAKVDDKVQMKILLEITELIKSEPLEKVFVIWYGVLVGLKNFQLLDWKRWSAFLDEAFNTKHCYVNYILSQLIGNLLNKLNDDNIEGRVLSCIENQSLSDNAIMVLTFVTKAMVLKGHKYTTLWTTKLLELSITHKQTCNSFRMILDDTYVCLSKFCFINERLLYKQKFFSDVTTYISSKDTIENTNYLTIVAHLVQGVPESLLHMNFIKLIKWIILYLDSSDDNIAICNICKIINKAIQSKVPDAFRYTSEILKVYLKLSTQNPAMKVRIEALKGIRLFTELPIHEIIRQKQDVINTLNLCVDDRKRLVRKEAMETRLKWYLIDSPM